MAKKGNNNLLGRYGFPSERDLIAQALGLAKASVPTPASIRRQYGRAGKDVQGFSNALVSLLRAEKGAAGEAYDPSIEQARAANEAAQARLAQLGPEFAVAGGAANDTSLNQLLANRAAGAEYGAKLPGIAAGRGVVAGIGIKNAQLDAERQRQDALRSSFAQAYDQVRSRALAEATAMADIRQSNRSFREGKREFNVDAAMRQAGIAADNAARSQAASKDSQQAFYAARDDAFSFAEKLYAGTKIESGGGSVASGGKSPGEKVKRPSWAAAYSKLFSRYAPELVHVYGVPRRQITRMLRQALRQAGFKKPQNRGPEGSGGTHVGGDLLPH